MTGSRVLVLQMCRMGDLLQTGPMLRGLRRVLPEAHVTLAVMDHFAGTPLPPRLYDRLVVFPHKSLCAELRSPDADWRTQLARVESFVGELGEAPYDLAINFTHSDVSSLLMALVSARDRRGPAIKPDRQRAVFGPWMQYFWANATSRNLGCFNLVDLFAWSAGVSCDGRGLEFDVSAEAEARVSAWLGARGLLGKRLLAVQLGASEEGKRWPAERFAATVDLLPRGSGEVVLVGTANERPLADQFKAAVHRDVHDAVGETTLADLGALLRRCALLMTNDTGTMHVAAAVGTRVMDISTGPVFVHETGPYGVGHVAVEPDIDCFPCAAGSECHHFACRECLSPVDAASIARFALGDSAAPRPQGVRLLTSRRTVNGRIEFRPLHADQVRTGDAIRHLASVMWEETLGAPRPPAGLIDRSPSETKEHLPAPHLSEGTGASPSLLAALEELGSVAATAAGIARQLPRAPRHLQPQLADRAHACLERLLRLGEVERACQPIVSFLLVEVESVLDTDLERVAAAHAHAYAAAAARARRLAALLGHPPCTE